jgi:hypothetical protein
MDTGGRLFGNGLQNCSCLTNSVFIVRTLNGT